MAQPFLSENKGSVVAVIYVIPREGGVTSVCLQRGAIGHTTFRPPSEGRGGAGLSVKPSPKFGVSK